MIECKNCGIKIKDKTKVCPMCDMVLSGDDKHNENTYPDVRQKTKILRRIVNIFSYFAIVLEIVFIVINYYNFEGVKWSAISGGAIIYVICLLHFIINDHYGHIKKMYVGFIGALFYIMLVDFVLGYKGWSLGVGMPVIVLTLDAIIIVCNKQAELGELSTASDILCYTRCSSDGTLFYEGTSKPCPSVDKFFGIAYFVYLKRGYWR